MYLHVVSITEQFSIDKIMVNAMAYTIELWMHAGGCSTRKKRKSRTRGEPSATLAC